LRIFILPDQHYAPEGDDNGGVDAQAEAVALQALRVIKPEVFVNLGDAGEWTSASHWNWSRRKRPPLEYQIPLLNEDALAVNKGLDKWDAVLDKIKCEKRIFICGNHDAWLDNFVAEHPYLAQYQPERVMRLGERGYEFHAYGQYVELVRDELFAYHGGHWSGINHTRDHVKNLGRSVIYGHVHDAETSTGRTLGGPISAWSMGCICKLSKPFLKGRPTNWKHGFGVVTVLDSGEFQVEFVPITGGLSYVWGKKIAA
jgi:hypothetical protein